MKDTGLRSGSLFVDREQAGEIFKCRERGEQGCHGTPICSARRKLKKSATDSEEKCADIEWVKKRKETCFGYQEFQK